MFDMDNDLNYMFDDFATDITIMHQGVTRVISGIIDRYYADYDVEYTPIASSVFSVQVKSIDIQNYDNNAVVIYSGDMYQINAMRHDGNGVTVMLLGEIYE